MSVISTFEFYKEEKMPYLYNGMGYPMAECFEEYRLFSNWIISKSQPLFIAYKYFEKLVSKGKINNITMDILKIEIYKFIKIEMNKILEETINHPRIIKFSNDTYFCPDISYLDIFELYAKSCGEPDDELREKNIGECSIISDSEDNAKNERYNRYCDLRQTFINLMKYDCRIVVIYQKYEDRGFIINVYNIDKVCEKTLKVIDCERGNYETLNMCNYNRHIFYIEDNDIPLDQIRFRFSIINEIQDITVGDTPIRTRDWRIRKSRFKKFMEKMKPIIEYDNEGYTEKYGEFVNDRYVLNYTELMNCI